MDSRKYYNQHAATYFENTVNLDVSHLMTPFMDHLEEGAAVLDLGCGSGRDCLTFLDAGYDVTALDGSSNMCELAEIHTDLDVLTMNFEDLDFEEVFDGIWALASLVHMKNDELLPVLLKINNALEKDGVFFMSLHKGTSDEIRDERYFAEYTKSEIKKMISQIPAFKIIDIWETDECRTDHIKREWLNILLKKN